LLYHTPDMHYECNVQLSDLCIGHNQHQHWHGGLAWGVGIGVGMWDQHGGVGIHLLEYADLQDEVSAARQPSGCAVPMPMPHKKIS
jgi:hypothetical protein